MLVPLFVASAALALPGEPRLVVDPPVGMVDSMVRVRLEGARPGQEITLRTSATDAEGATWRSEAIFRANGRGVVDVAGQPSSRGTYTGTEAMGLFWSMRQDVVSSAPVPPRPGQEGHRGAQGRSLRVDAKRPSLPSSLSPWDRRSR